MKLHIFPFLSTQIKIDKSSSDFIRKMYEILQTPTDYWRITIVFSSAERIVFRVRGCNMFVRNSFRPNGHIIVTKNAESSTCNFSYTLPMDIQVAIIFFNLISILLFLALVFQYANFIAFVPVFFVLQLNVMLFFGLFHSASAVHSWLLGELFEQSEDMFFQKAQLHWRYTE